MKGLLFSSLASSGAMSMKDDVLAAQYEGIWYVMIRGAIAPTGLSLNNKESAVEKIYAACAGLKRDDLDFVYSGVPFHSYESSSSAQKEISIISTVSLIAIILLFLLIFRSILPIAAAVGAAGFSILLAFSSALLCFREVHILTLVFGTTLIGTCVDYSVHFFIQWKRNSLLKSGVEVRSRIFKGIALSFVSSVVCFLVLLFAPFVILRQFAVFSFMGLLSSFLTVNCIFPLLKKPAGDSAARSSVRITSHAPYKITLLIILGLVLTSLLFINRSRVRVENNIASLYTMQGKLLESEMISGKVLRTGSAGWYFIVSGESPEETMEHEEALRAALDREIEKGSLGSYAALSVFIPSEKTQRENYRAAGNLLPLASDQYLNLGFPPQAADFFRVDYESAAEHFVRADAELPPFLADLASNLWIGPAAGGKFYSCVMPLHARDENIFRQIAAQEKNVFFVNKVKDIGAELDRLTKIMLGLFLLAYGIIAIMVRFFYSWKKTLRICAVPLLLVLAVIAILACLDIPLGFFPVVGLILVFGLGLDYIFYITEADRPGNSADKGLTSLAIFLSFATTALSFGALALSSFTPVHLFGLAVFSGLGAAYISSMLLMRSDASENQRNSGSGDAASPGKSDSGFL
jgi:predicted exporter